MSRLMFEAWLAKDTTLSADRDSHGYKDFTVAIMWHTWRAATASVRPNWPSHAAAIADPMFHQVRAIMGTQNFGQEDCLRRAILHAHQALDGDDEPAQQAAEA